jgi:hypothetical protein
METLGNLVGTKREDGPGHWKKLHTEASWFVFITKYYSDGKTWDEMDWACGMYGADDTYTKDIGGEN